jgi:hypothetical protein
LIESIKDGISIILKYEDICLSKLIDNNERLHISNIYKNPIVTGSKIMKICEYYGIKNNYKIISLMDNAMIITINYQFMLRCLSILIYGESWYNRLGYKSDNYCQEINDNKAIINLPISEFLRLIKYTNNINIIDDSITIKDYFSNNKSKLDIDITNLINYIDEYSILNISNELHSKNIN